MIKTTLGLFLVMVANIGVAAPDQIKITGELQALYTDFYSPPRVKNVWQYTIAFMAEDGSVIKQGMPVIMFKTDAVQTNIDDAQGKLSIKQSEIKNNKAIETEKFEKKAIEIAEKKMELEKANRKAELPKSILAKNDYQENQLKLKLAQKQYDSAVIDNQLSNKKSKTDKEILQSEIKNLEADLGEYTASMNSMKLMARSDGIVIHKSNWQGEKYAVGDTSWGNRRLIEVANLNQIIAKLEIPENNIKHIKKDQTVMITLDALPDKEFKGTIKSLSQVVRIKSKNKPSKILEAVVYIDNVDTELKRPGMRLIAHVDKEIQSTENAE